MAFWYLASTFGNLWVLLTNAGVRNEAVTAQIASTGLSENAFLMFFFAGFAFVAAAAFALYARALPDAGQLPRSVIHCTRKRIALAVPARPLASTARM